MAAIESECALKIHEDLISFKKPWKVTILEKCWCRKEIRSKGDSEVWYLVEFPNGFKTVDCKCVFKTNITLKVILKDIRLALLLKVSPRKDGINYKEIFSTV